MNRRTDRTTELYIDATLNSVAYIGIREAARTLRDLDIQVDTALRVLTRPSERRGHYTSGSRLLARAGPRD
jgi:hypothetical protein